MENLKEECTVKNLWDCIVAFQKYPFYTSSGLPFQYTLKIGKGGEYTKELFIDRSLLWRFGVIKVPEEVEIRMKGKRRE